MNYLELILNQLNLRLDAAATAALDLQLEHLRARTYDIKYPEMKARMLIPVDTSVDPGAETIAYHQWSEIGMAEINLHMLLKTMIDKGASDLHVTTGSSPQLRIDGFLMPLKMRYLKRPAVFRAE